MQIIRTPNDWSATGHLSFLVWSGIQGMTGELLPQNYLQLCLACSVVDFWGFCSIIPGVERETCSQATPRLLNTWPWKLVQCNRKCCCASRYLLDLLNVIAFISEVGSYDYRNHLDINASWKSLVAICVCL